MNRHDTIRVLPALGAAPKALPTLGQAPRLMELFWAQFVDPGAAHKALAFSFLGLVFIFNGALWNLFVAWWAARMASSLASPVRLALWLNRTLGALFVYLGIRLVISHGS